MQDGKFQDLPPILTVTGAQHMEGLLRSQRSLSIWGWGCSMLHFIVSCMVSKGLESLFSSRTVCGRLQIYDICREASASRPLLVAPVEDVVTGGTGGFPIQPKATCLPVT